ncbi:hypothetical protein [Streptomyces sp. Amel2xC10]|uniref:hypothetical protein n=1 Tax=Streptomyces sp. Amel2xC10 TaxID=1305826 RepID=UPI000A151D40|nr:hypothetical protein [Streptomyces sp. Amel2xC10]
MAAELDGVTVWDGPELSKAVPKEMLSIAFTGDENDSDIDSSALPEGMSGRDRETFTIRCAAAVLIGSGRVREARRRAYELYAGAGAAIARDPSLGRTVMRARLGTHTFKHMQTASGAQALLIFGVDCDAFTRR